LVIIPSCQRGLCRRWLCLYLFTIQSHRSPIPRSPVQAPTRVGRVGFACHEKHPAKVRILRCAPSLDSILRGIGPLPTQSCCLRIVASWGFVLDGILYSCTGPAGNGAAVRHALRPCLDVRRLTVSSALGTPLEWPEAKKVADQVRNWGIEVSPRHLRAGIRVDVSCSNSLLSGGTPKGKRGTHCSGATRYFPVSR